MRAPACLHARRQPPYTDLLIQTSEGRDMIRPVLLACVGCFLLAPGPAAAAGAEQLPIRKAGLWEIKMVRTGSPVPDVTMQHCTHETIDRPMNGMARPSDHHACARPDLHQT